jgi:hypothetical protein
MVYTFLASFRLILLLKPLTKGQHSFAEFCNQVVDEALKCCSEVPRHLSVCELSAFVTEFEKFTRNKALLIHLFEPEGADVLAKLQSQCLENLVNPLLAHRDTVMNLFSAVTIGKSAIFEEFQVDFFPMFALDLKTSSISGSIWEDIKSKHGLLTFEASVLLLIKFRGLELHTLAEHLQFQSS